MSGPDNHAKHDPGLAEIFPPATPEQWREAAEKSLKGAPFERLARQTLDGYALQPAYHPADMDALPHLGSLPGQSPYVRGSQPGAGPWALRSDPDASLPDSWNAIALEELAGGATTLGLIPDRATVAGLDPDTPGAADLVGQGGLSVACRHDLRRALETIDLSRTPITLGATASPALAAIFVSAADGATLRGSLGLDPLGCIASAGRLPAPLDQLYPAMTDAVAWAAEHAPNLQVITVHGHAYHDGGASASQELGFTLATAAEYLRSLIDRGIQPDAAARCIALSLSVGTRCLSEVAKLRAARLLWDRIAEVFGCSAPARAARIHVAGSGWTSTARDPWVNMLRTTVQTIAAVVGGAQSVSAVPFDRQAGVSGAFSRRIARNTQLILREEAHLAAVSDPAGGSWTVEAMTDQIGRAAWGLFQQVEGRGGMGAALMAGFPQQAVAEQVEQRLGAVARRKEPFVGVTSYADVYEKLLQREALDLQSVRARREEQVTCARKPEAAGALKKLPAAGGGARFAALVAAAGVGATIQELNRALADGDAGRAMRAIPARRGVEAFERIRDAAEAYQASQGGLPSCLLVSLGPKAEHRARAEWTAGALGAGGFAVVETSADDVELKGIQVVVACGKDERYPDGIPALRAKAESAGIPLVLAGKPPDGATWAEGLLTLNVKTDLVRLFEQLYLRFTGQEVRS